MFDINRFNDIAAAPINFKLLERVPLTITDVEFPLELASAAVDEIPIVLVDFETTGFDLTNDGITELGLVRLYYSPSNGEITRIENAASIYNDPGQPISAFITNLTGITDVMVRGKSVVISDIEHWFADDPIVIAHQASFDRGFFDKHFPTLSNLRWACSINDIKWRDLGFESGKLEYLLTKIGFFYEGHRASIDCLALAWLLFNKKTAMAQLVKRLEDKDVVVRALSSPYKVKDALKDSGYKWSDGSNGKEKHWFKTVSESKLIDEKQFLDKLYDGGSSNAVYEELDARGRYKSS